MTAALIVAAVLVALFSSGVYALHRITDDSDA